MKSNTLEIHYVYISIPLETNGNFKKMKISFFGQKIKPIRLYFCCVVLG